MEAVDVTVRAVPDADHVGLGNSPWVLTMMAGSCNKRGVPRLIIRRSFGGFWGITPNVGGNGSAVPTFWARAK